MSSSTHTRVKYTGGTPTGGGSVTLINTREMDPEGGVIQNNKFFWYTYDLNIDQVGVSVVGEYTLDGSTWIEFYRDTSVSSVPSNPDTVRDEVYIGMYPDVRFTFNNGATAQGSPFNVNQTLDSFERGSASI